MIVPELPYTISEVVTSCKKLHKMEYNGRGLEIAAIQGMARQHKVFLNYETMACTYLCEPDGGPYEALKKWAKTKQPCKTWTPIHYTKIWEVEHDYHERELATQRAAIEFAVNAAMAEIEREYGGGTKSPDVPDAKWQDKQD